MEKFVSFVDNKTDLKDLFKTRPAIFKFIDTWLSHAVGSKKPLKEAY